MREHETRSNREFCLFVISSSYIYIYIYISELFGWKVKTGLDVASRQRCFVSCLTHQEFNTYIEAKKKLTDLYLACVASVSVRFRSK